MIIFFVVCVVWLVSSIVMITLFATSGAKRLEGGSWLKIGNATKNQVRYSERVKKQSVACKTAYDLAY